MRVFNKTQFNNLEAANYYGNISISLLTTKEVQQIYKNIEYTDYVRIRNNPSLDESTILCKDKGKYVASVDNYGVGFYHANFAYSDGLIVPVLYFSKPLETLFPEKNNELVEFGIYPKTQVPYSKNLDEEKQKTSSKIAYYWKAPVIDGQYIYFSDVYEYNNEYYIRDVVNYIKLEPIKWLCDYENNRLICMQTLTCSVPFSPTGKKVNFEHSFCKSFLEKYLLPDILQFVRTPEREDKKDKPKDSILNDLRELIAMTEFIKDADDKALIMDDIVALARIYGKELLKIKRDEQRTYATERELIKDGILPYYVYLKGEIEREIDEDNKDLEDKKIAGTINKLVDKASFISDEGIKNEILGEIAELKQCYLSKLYRGNKTYQRIDFSKPMDFKKLYSGEVELTLETSRPFLTRELVEKELEISRKIDKEINSNDFRREFSEFEDYINGVTKK